MYRVREKFSHPLVLWTSTIIIKFGCPKSKSSCPKRLARNSKTIRHFMFLITLLFLTKPKMELLKTNEMTVGWRS